MSGVTMATRQLEAVLSNSREYLSLVGVPLGLDRVVYVGNQIFQTRANTCNHTRPQAPANLKPVVFFFLTNPRTEFYGVRAPSTNVAEY